MCHEVFGNGRDHSVRTGKKCDVLHRSLNEVDEGHLGLVQFQTIRLDASEVEYLGDDAGHALGIRVDGLDELISLLVRESIPPRQERR
jgi:hypothetical protein